MVTFIQLMTTHTFKKRNKRCTKNSKVRLSQKPLWMREEHTSGERVLCNCLCWVSSAFPWNVLSWLLLGNPAPRGGLPGCSPSRALLGRPVIALLNSMHMCCMSNKNGTFKVSSCGNTENPSFPTQFNYSQRLFKAWEEFNSFYCYF